MRRFGISGCWSNPEGFWCSALTLEQDLRNTLWHGLHSLSKFSNCHKLALVKDKQEKDKIGTKPDKNEKCGKAR
nr:hypothetical protein [Tanacetum cinerariifolium]